VFLIKRGLQVAADDPKLIAAAPSIAPRAITFADVAEALDYFFREPPLFDAKAQAKFLTEDKRALTRELADALQTLELWTAAALEEAVKAWVETKGLELKDAAQPARVALTGRSASPGLFEVIEILGKDLALTRLRAV